MYARILALGAMLLLSGAVAAQSQSATYVGRNDTTLQKLPTPPSSSGATFCDSPEGTNVTFAVRVDTSAVDSGGRLSVDEDIGSVQANVTYTLVAYCPFSPASSLQLGIDVSGTATPGADYSVSATSPQFNGLNRGTSGQTIIDNRTYSITDDSTEEPTETILVDLLALAQLDSTTFIAGSPTIDTEISIIDNDGAPPNADLAITQSNNAPIPLIVGSTFQKTLTVANNGPGPAFGIQVQDTLPGQLAFVDSGCGATISGQTVTYIIDSLPSGAVDSCALSVRVGSAGTIINTAGAFAFGPGSGNDPAQADNSTSQVIGTSIANQAPVVTDGSATSINGAPVVIDLGPRASDPDNGPSPLMFSYLPPAMHGLLDLQGSTATYTPEAGFVGTDVLRFCASDGTDPCSQFTITVTVTGPASNLPPVVLMNGSASTAGTAPVSVALTPLVSDPEGDALTFAIAIPPPSAQGTATLSGTTLTFTPAQGFEGSAVIGLTVRDATSPPVALSVTVSVTGNPPNRPPVANMPSAAAPQSSGGAEVSVDLAPLFTDPDGDMLTFAIATQSNIGAARIVGTTAFYLPNANAEGPDQFTVRASDPAGGSATVVITVGVVANLDPAETEQDLNTALDTLPGGGSEVAQAAVAAVAIACGEAASGTGALTTCQAIVDAAEANDGAAVEDALENLAAEEVSAQSNVATEIMSQQKANVAARMSAVRGGARGLDVAGLSVFAGDGALSLGMFQSRLNAAEDTTAAGGASDFRPSPWGVFVNGSVGGGNRDAGARESGFDFDNYGLTAGVDYRLNDRAFVGLALGYSASEVDLDEEAGELDTDGLGLTGYWSWYGAQGWYTDGSLGYFRNDYQQTRAIDLGAIGLARELALSETDASQLVATFGVGYEFARNGWLLTPEFRIEYADTEVDGFDETGANTSGFLLSFPDQSFQSLQYSAGLQVARAISTANGIAQPFLRLDWFHESDNDGFTLIPRLRTDPTQPFAAIVIDDPDRNFGSISGGVSWVRPGGTQLYFSLFRTFAYDDLEQWVLRGGLRWEF